MENYWAQQKHMILVLYTVNVSEEVTPQNCYIALNEVDFRLTLFFHLPFSCLFFSSWFSMHNHTDLLLKRGHTDLQIKNFIFVLFDFNRKSTFFL